MSRGSLYTFDAFRRNMHATVRLLSPKFREPDAVWPGLLFLDAPHGISVERFEVAGMSDDEKRNLAAETLPARIVEAQARRCWVMPARGPGAEDDREYLALVIGEHGRSVVDVLPIIRTEDEPPRLGRPLAAPFGPE